MEFGVDKAKVVAAGILAALMLFAVGSPALAQANAQGGNVNFQLQFCPQVVSQYASANQYNSGGGDAAAIAQNLGITQNAVNTCLQNAFPDGAGATPPETTETTTPPETTEPTPPVATAEQREEKIVMSANLPTVLANTGGEATANTAASASTKVAMLLPAGALLMAFGATMFYLRGSRA